MRRVLTPEILDSLPFDDPRAVRSREDLRRVNALMGNQRWLWRQVQELSKTGRRWGELGAGSGEMASRLAKNGVPCTGFDLNDRPKSVPASVDWVTGDCRETLQQWEGEGLVGSLILHHFDEADLAKLGGLFANYEVLVFAEPLRTRLAKLLGYLLLPFVGEVTRHDMMVSIEAGFLPGELPRLLNLEKGWRWYELTTWRGGLRSLAVRTSSSEAT